MRAEDKQDAQPVVSVNSFGAINPTLGNRAKDRFALILNLPDKWSLPGRCMYVVADGGRGVGPKRRSRKKCDGDGGGGRGNSERGYMRHVAQGKKKK